MFADIYSLCRVLQALSELHILPYMCSAGVSERVRVQLLRRDISYS